MPDTPALRPLARALAPALLLAATATGCGLLPIERDAPSPAGEHPTPEPSPADTPSVESPETRPEPEPEANPEAPDEAPPPLRIARSDQAEQERSATLREQGHDTLDPGRLGYYMDVLGARLRQELAEQPAAIDHRDEGIRVTLAEGNGQTRALETIGHLLHEFGASLVTVVAHRGGVDPDTAQRTAAEGAALAAGEQLERAGVSPERLVLRGTEANNAGANPGSLIPAPRLELLIQPLTAS